MTIEELAAIRARVEKATPGSAVGYNALCRDHSEMSEEALREAFAWLQASHRGLDIIRADAGRLLAEVERLRAEAAELWTRLHAQECGYCESGRALLCRHGANPYAGR